MHKSSLELNTLSVSEMKPHKLSTLRAALHQMRLNGFLVPRSDQYLGENIQKCDERLAWLTGFKGSAGLALVLENKACVFTDSRYLIQIKQEIDINDYEIKNIQNEKTEHWLFENTSPGQTIGYDPSLHSTLQIEKFEKALKRKNVVLKSVERNPVDRIWHDRPQPEKTNVEVFPLKYAGETSASKRQRLAKNLAQQNIYAALITSPESIAWLLNVRGADLKHTPVPLSNGVLYSEEGHFDWFIEPERIPEHVHDALGEGVQILPPNILEITLSQIAERSIEKHKTIQIDKTRSAAWYEQNLQKYNARLSFEEDPCVDARALKNNDEQAASRNAHIEDGAVMVRFMIWLETALKNKEKLNELIVAQKLEDFRSQPESYNSLSFETISGFNANGAIIHYAVNTETNAEIKPPGLLLLDSGGQYRNGTTDVTRTVAIGKPKTEYIRNYTTVLKGHINLACAEFPEGTVGAQLDALARKPLWAEGLDYGHGTGHGVGCYLSVHEEAANISPRGTKALKPGMILSNEPGYYKEGEYGIRIENLVLVVDTGKTFEDGRRCLAFENLTKVPYDTKLIDKMLLDKKEIDWINAYHQTVRNDLRPHLSKDENLWLEQKTRPL